ncbi:MAG: hypothetical protein HRU06_19890 [Oceanospirillaceae bacterium]|nr:hypothetical protein [Colwellia sp.]NQZ33536.1 hypothetical protein [Oceanospirillaceae bacterium]
MKRTILASCLTLAVFGANAASLDDISISGFGSVGIGQASNAVGYAGYTDKHMEWEQETLGGLQFDFQINERAKFVTQIVSNSRYDFTPKFEMAYAAYDAGSFTVRAGKLRLPLFFYSDYVDLGYAYPMLRPSQEVYENVVLKGYTGVELLIPIEFENSSLLLQPVIGVATVSEDDSKTIGEVKLDNMVGLSSNWNYDDWTVRGSYFTAKADPTCNDTTTCAVATALGVAGKKGTFISAGIQYDNGDLLANLETTSVKMEGYFSDTRSVSGLLGYRIGEFTPYVAASWVETTDNDERPASPTLDTLNYERASYSIGSRWDFEQNMAFKLDATYVDFKDTNGGVATNAPGSSSYKGNSMVISARIDFIF